MNALESIIDHQASGDLVESEGLEGVFDRNEVLDPGDDLRHGGEVDEEAGEAELEEVSHTSEEDSGAQVAQRGAK